MLWIVDSGIKRRPIRVFGISHLRFLTQSNATDIFRRELQFYFDYNHKALLLTHLGAVMSIGNDVKKHTSKKKEKEI